jgi:hypothetical protein
MFPRKHVVLKQTKPKNNANLPIYFILTDVSCIVMHDLSNFFYHYGAGDFHHKAGMIDQLY